jgi:integrase
MRTPRLKPVETAKGWLVDIPATLAKDGKRSRRYFQSRNEAKDFCKHLRIRIAKHGTGARILAPLQADIAARAFELLGELAPEKLVEAVREYMERHDVRASSVPFEDAFSKFANAQPRSPSYAQSLRQFRARLSALHGRLLCDITAGDIAEAMDDFPSSVFNYGLRILGGLFNWGCKRDWCGSNPIQKLDRRKLAPREVEIYSPAEVGQLLRAADPSLIPWLTTCMFAGLRSSEARKVVWGDFDFIENFIRVRAAVSKIHRPRAIPMEKNLRDWLIPLRRSDAELIAPQGANVLRKQLRSAHRIANVRQIKHGPRHCFASYLLARDQNIDALVLGLGHTDPKMLFGHYHRVASARDAEHFWSIRPKARKIISIAAAR